MSRLSFAQRAVIRKIHAAGGKIAASKFDGRSSRVVAKLVELGVVARDESLPTYPVLELTEAGRRHAEDIATALAEIGVKP